MKKTFLFNLIFSSSGNIYSAVDSRNEIDPSASRIRNKYTTDRLWLDILKNHNVDSLVTTAAGCGVVDRRYYIISAFNLNAFYKK